MSTGCLSESTTTTAIPDPTTITTTVAGSCHEIMVKYFLHSLHVPF
jgi:hypothetical protein